MLNISATIESKQIYLDINTTESMQYFIKVVYVRTHLF